MTDTASGATAPEYFTFTGDPSTIDAAAWPTADVTSETGQVLYTWAGAPPAPLSPEWAEYVGATVPVNATGDIGVPVETDNGTATVFASSNETAGQETPVATTQPPVVTDPGSSPAVPLKGTPSPLVQSAQPVIASPSRNAFGEIVDAGAILTGNRDEHVAVQTSLLTNIVKRSLGEVEHLIADIEAHVEAEIDALMRGELPPPLPASLKPAAPVVDETTSQLPEGETAVPPVAGETTLAAPGATETTSAS